MAETENLIEVEKLRKYFPIYGTSGVGSAVSSVHAVEDVSLFIRRGETLGLVGESGCGKSTLGRTILRLHKPTSGRIVYDGKVIYDSEKHIEEKIKPYRRKMQLIFQDPSASLDPRMTAENIIGEALDTHHLAHNRRERHAKVVELLCRVGLNEEQGDRFPHEFSGGQQQRIGIARALAVDPEFIVCDEPISALDVSIQSQIVNMLEDMQQELGLTYLFIAHDISVVRHISNRIGVMYLGSLVELAESRELNRHPLHPYTRTLLSAVPVPDPDVSRARQRIILEGDVPSPIDPPPGCRFAGRCPYATEKCHCAVPPLKEAAPGHYVSCHLFNSL